MSRYSPAAVRKMILAGEAPRAEWMERITEVDLSDTQVSDLAPLAGLANLESLLLSSTKVSDLTPLTGLANLHSLGLFDTLVSRAEIASLQASLPRLRIYQ